MNINTHFIDIVDFLPDPILIINTGGRIICWNKALATLTGVDACDMIGKNNYEYSIPFYGVRRPMLVDMIVSKTDNLRSKYETIYSDSGAIIAETSTARVRGHKAYLWMHATPLLDKEGVLVGAIETIRDITSQKINEIELENAEKKFRVLFDKAPDAYLLYRNGKVTECNAAAQDMLRGTFFDIIGLTPNDLSPEQDKAIIAEEINSCMYEVNKFGSAKHELLRKRLDGTVFWAEVVVAPINLSEENIIFASLRDITERKWAESNMNKAFEIKRALLDNSAVGVFLISDDNTIKQASKRACDMFGYTFGELESKNYSILFDGDCLKKLNDNLICNNSSTKECIFKRKDGTDMWCIVTLTYINNLDKTMGIVATLVDITIRKVTEEKLKLAADVITNAHEGICITDIEGNIINVNPAFETITGYTLKEVKGKNPSILKSDRHNKEFYEEMWHTIKNKKQWIGEIFNKNKNGTIYPEKLSISSIRDNDNNIKNFVGIFYDITILKEQEKKLEDLAYHDALTHLPNRITFFDRLQQSISISTRKNKTISVCYLDLDNFKPVNDTYGHDAGDILLKEISNRIKNTIRTSDTVARFGGDEFVIILQETKEESDIIAVVDKILKQISSPVYIDKDKKVQVSGSIGISIFPKDGNEPDILVRKADIAMYKAKEKGKNKYQFF